MLGLALRLHKPVHLGLDHGEKGVLACPLRRTLVTDSGPPGNTIWCQETALKPCMLAALYISKISQYYTCSCSGLGLVFLFVCLFLLFFWGGFGGECA